MEEKEGYEPQVIEPEPAAPADEENAPQNEAEAEQPRILTEAEREQELLIRMKGLLVQSQGPYDSGSKQWYEGERRYNAEKKSYGYFKYLVFRAAILALCYQNQQVLTDQQPANMYTRRHYDFNKLMLAYGVKYYTLVIVGNFSLQNMGIRTRHVWFNAILLAFCVFVRIIVAICMIHTTYYDLFTGLQVCWTLNTDNWWTNSNEPFLTNESYVNALVCWTYWVAVMPCIYMMMFFAIMYIGIVVRLLSTGKSKEVVDSWYMIGDQNIIRWIRDYLFGCQLDHIYRVDYGYTSRKSAQVGEEEYEQVNQRYYSQYEPKGCKSVFFNDVYDCPICLNPFEENQDVKIIKCEDGHIFHTCCWDEYTKTSAFKEHCVRNKFNFAHGHCIICRDRVKVNVNINIS